MVFSMLFLQAVRVKAKVIPVLILWIVLEKARAKAVEKALVKAVVRAAAKVVKTGKNKKQHSLI